MAQLKIYGGYIQATREHITTHGTTINIRQETATAALIIFRRSEAEARNWCQKAADERYPKKDGWEQHQWGVAEADGITIER